MGLIPISRPDLRGNEERYVVDAIRSSWISSTGPFVDRFERDFAEMCGTTSAIAVANGTVALHLALLALDVGPGDEVIVPSLTYVATANAVRYCGAEPVFVDVDPATWCIDPALVEAAISPRTRGLIPVHLYGHPADMDPLNAIARTHGLWVVEDAAEAHLGRYRGRTVGSLGTMATFSFYGNKMFTSGEGGALTLDDPTLTARARTLRGQGVDPDRRYYFPIVGYNYRLTNVACALLCAQLERAEEMLADRTRVFGAYEERLAGVEGVGFQPVAEWAQATPWLYSITIDPRGFGMSRDQLATALAAEEIETRPFFVPIHSLPPYGTARRADPIDLPVTMALSATGMNLPTYPELDEASIDRVVDAIRRAHAGSLDVEGHAR